MPEDGDIAIRFPGVDPVGRYSLLDMKFAQRQAQVDAALQTCPPETQDLVRSLKQSLTENPRFRETAQAMEQSARRHRILTRASKLCLDEQGRRLLHRQARSLEAGDAALRYDLLLQGMEYASGVRRGPLPPDAAQFYRQTLQTPLPRPVLDGTAAFLRPKSLKVYFPDFEHRLLQVQFSDPRNWGRSPERLEPAPIDLDALLIPYAAAAAGHTLTAAFRGRDGLDPAGSIRVDGTPLRERMEPDSLPTPFQVRERTAQYVSAALMADRTVEIDLPGGKRPVPVSRTGYQPPPERKPLCAAWARHCAKQGFARSPAAPVLRPKAPPQMGGPAR